MPLFDSETPPIQDQSDSENVGGEGDLKKAKYSQFQEIAYVNFLISIIEVVANDGLCIMQWICALN
ncbi:hypothetical protein ACE6H2_002315 [Prunus campanulata]